ncbi:hypothetical protein PRZ48_002568 [Zasmidium cellare]|uniref:AMP-dependent synthetase/ligase domain-containing protein n=1 Tax=Zasmidium cellare TaxID=395010 RepID=A0ABR0ESZ4_ZASCE|nr:hypothetical protein PRZ48_002568 [Zasmidium cellare]
MRWPDVCPVSDHTLQQQSGSLPILYSATLTRECRLLAKCILGEDNLPGWISLAKVSSSGDISDSRLHQIDSIDQGGDRVAVVLHTSGTSTGKPKGVPLRNVLAACMNQVGLAELTDCFLTSSPNFGVIFSFMVLACGAWGKEVLMPAPAFSPAAVLNAMRRCSSRCISTICIPAQIRLLSNELAKADYGELNSMKRLMLGGDLATKDVLQQAQKLFPSAKLSTSYGMTEACGVIGFLGSSIVRMPTYKGIISLGKPVAGSHVRIVKPVDDGISAKGLIISPRNEVGDLHLGGPCVAQQYVDNV